MLRIALAEWEDWGRRERTPTCVLIMDLDGFKAVNDELGHPMGDLALVAFADRMRSVLRASDTAARLGGDEFAVLLEDDRAPGEASTIANRILEALHVPVAVGE